MEEIEGLPLVFNSQQDNLLFGKLFPQGYTFPKFPEPQVPIWKEEWKTRTPEEIQQYFFPEAQVIKKNGIVVSDTTGVFKNANFSQQSEENCPCEKDKAGNCPCQEATIMLDEVVIEQYGHPRKILGFDDITIWFFTSSDGAKLLRAHRNLKESKSKSSNLLAVFMETSDSFNVFGSVMDFVVGDDVKKVFNNHKHWSKVVEFLERNEINVSQKDTKNLFNQALNRETVFAYFNRLAHQLLSRGSQALFMTLADNFSLIAKGIQGFKYDAKDWDNSNPEFSSEKAPFIFVRYQKYNTTTLEKVRFKNTDEIKVKFKESKDLINAHKSKLPDTIRIPLENFIQLAEQKITLFFELFKENHTKFLKVLDLGNEVLNAFVCGFIDGFVDILAFVFSLFDYAFKAIGGSVDYTVNQGFYWSLLLEYIENAIQALSKFDFLDFAKKIISLPLETLSKFVTFIQNISLPNINFTKVGYFGGYIVFGIVQIALEILFTKGAATLERIFAKGALALKGVVKKAAGFADDVFAALSHLIKQIEKGAENFAAYISKIIDDIFKWLEDLFRSGKGDEVLDDIEVPLKGWSESDLDWMASRSIGNLGGRILRASQIRKLRKLLNQKGIHLIVEGDPKRITKLFKPVDDFNTIDDLFYVMRHEGFPGGFNANTKQFFLSKNATEIVAFHEMAHLKHFEQIGEAYLTLSKLEKETFVWQQILANRSKWTKAELEDALKYINRERKKAGINEPIKIKI